MSPTELNTKIQKHWIFNLPISIDRSRQKPVYTIQGKFNYHPGYIVEVENEHGRCLLHALEINLSEDFPGEFLVFRGIEGDRLEQILASGHDVPGIKKGDSTCVAGCMGYTFGYLCNPNDILDMEETLKRDACIMVYSEMSFARTGFMAEFLANPLDALRAVILLKVDGAK